MRETPGLLRTPMHDVIYENPRKLLLYAVDKASGTSRLSSSPVDERLLQYLSALG